MPASGDRREEHLLRVRARSGELRRRRSLLRFGAGAATVAVCALAVVVVAPGSHHDAVRVVTPVAPPSSTGPTVTGGRPSPTPGPATTAGPGTTAGLGTTPGPATTGASPRYQPLWPFSTSAQARAWEASSPSGGQQPWHLDAGQTALAFTTGYLQLGGINRVLRVTTAGADARVAVGFVTQGSNTATAAVVHLVRWGSGPGAPWEVVGTDDTDFSLTTPVYGASVRSPVSVGGQITGVDENIKVQVRQPSSPAPIGTSCCVPAGGTASPWRTTVSFAGATDPVLTVVALTGGHVQPVERFTITALTTR